MSDKNRPSIGGAFAHMTAPFAVHPKDEERAFEYLNFARENNMGWSDVELEIRNYLKEKGVRDEFIDEQVEKASILFKPWLLD